MKKGKRSAVEAFPVSDRFAFGEEAKMRLRHRSLLRDYEDLLKETEAKRMRLQQANQKKLRLLAEVKFLRRKYKSLTTNQFGKSKKPQSMPSHLSNAAIQNNSSVIDLNQLSLPIGECMDEQQLNSEPAIAERLRKMDPDPVANDLNLSVCRDVGNAPNRVHKRKITWQDPVALRV